MCKLVLHYPATSFFKNFHATLVLCMSQSFVLAMALLTMVQGHCKKLNTLEAWLRRSLKTSSYDKCVFCGMAAGKDRK